MEEVAEVVEVKAPIIIDEAKLEEMGADAQGVVPVEKLEAVDLDTLQAYAKEKGDQIAADAESKGEVIAPVEP